MKILRFFLILLYSSPSFADPNCERDERGHLIMKDGKPVSYVETKSLGTYQGGEFIQILCGIGHYDIYVEYRKDGVSIYSPAGGGDGNQYFSGIERIDDKIVITESSDYIGNPYTAYTYQLDVKNKTFKLLHKKEGLGIKDEFKEYKAKLKVGDLCGAKSMLNQHSGQSGGSYGGEEEDIRSEYYLPMIKAVHKQVAGLIAEKKFLEVQTSIKIYLFRDIFDLGLGHTGDRCQVQGNEYWLGVPDGSLQEVNDLGYWLWLSGDSRASLSVLAAVLRKDPKRSAAWLNLADALFDTNYLFFSQWAYQNYLELVKSPPAVVAARIQERLSLKPTKAPYELREIHFIKNKVPRFARLEDLVDEYAELDFSVARIEGNPDIPVEYRSVASAVSAFITVKKSLILDEILLPAGAVVRIGANPVTIKPVQTQYLPTMACPRPGKYLPCFSTFGHTLVNFREEAISTEFLQPSDLAVDIAKSPKPLKVTANSRQITKLESDVGFMVGDEELTLIGYNAKKDVCAKKFVNRALWKGLTLPAGSQYSFCLNNTHITLDLPPHSSLLGYQYQGKTQILFHVGSDRTSETSLEGVKVQCSGEKHCGWPPGEKIFQQGTIQVEPAKK